MIVVYLYDKDWNALTQLFDVFDCEVTLKLNNYSEASFSISSDSSIDLTDIQEFNEVKICEESEWSAQTVFHWIVKAYKLGRDTIDVYCRSFEWLLARKKTATTTTYSDTVNNVADTLLDEINARDDTGITLDCWVTDSITIDVTKGQSLFSILENIASKWYEFVIRDKVLYVKESIGIDRSVAWDNYFQLKKDYLDTSDRNISDVSLKSDSDNLANAIMGKTAWFSTDATSITKYGRIEDIITTADWWESDMITSELARRKDWVLEFDVEVVVTDTFFARIWDTLACYIDRWNWLLYYDDTVKLVEKRVKYGKIKNIAIKVATKNLTIQDLISRIQSNAKRIERLELQ